MPSVNTARGPVEASDLGVTLMHEHIAIRDTAIYANWPELDDREACLAAALERFRALEERGIGTVVDVTPPNLGRDVGLISDVQAATSVNIVVATGMYWNIPLYWQGREVDEIASAFVREILEGIGRSGVRAGVIKLATQGEMDANNEACLRAAARAHRQTGVPITTHAIPQELGRDQQRVLLEEGVDLARTVIGHQGNMPPPDFYRELMDAGSTIGIDNFGIDSNSAGGWHDSLGRADVVAELCTAGYAGRIVLSHDSMCSVDWGAVRQLRAANPNWHSSWISDTVLPALRERGVSEAQIDQMLVENPRRLLDPVTPY